MADASQDERKATFKLIKEVHNCPAVGRFIRSRQIYQQQTKENRGASEQNWICPNRSISPPLSVYSLLLFHCST